LANAVALSLSIVLLSACVRQWHGDHSPYPTRLLSAKPLVALANYLIDSGQGGSAEEVYSCALSVFAKIPSRVDQPLIEALTGYHMLLEKQNRREEAWQIKARIAQKSKIFCAGKYHERHFEADEPTVSSANYIR